MTTTRMIAIRVLGLSMLSTLMLGSMGTKVRADPPVLGSSRVAFVDSTILLDVSGILQEEDQQYVHDLFCMETGKLIGSVRMRWAHKYGHRYGGVGIEVTGALENLDKIPDGRLRIRIRTPNVGNGILVVDRLIKIPD